ncbi:MAG: ABC transporter permease [Bacteroidetes bacterium]|nr:ABC transporter permease [Bacteroidota bacterium]
MSKIIIIIQREYFSRVKKKSFIIMTILGPILFSALMIVPLWLSMQEQEKHFVEVIDDSKLVDGFMRNDKNVHYDYPPVSLEVAKRDLYKTDYTAILWVPENILSSRKVILYFKSHPGIMVQEKIRSGIEDILYENQLEAEGIDMEKVNAAHIQVNIVTEKQSASGTGERTNTGVNMGIGFGAGILIYLFIFMYGVQVMRGVIEEKTSRIVEVIISSVKPFQLMMGKITGIAMVGLTQFVLWVVLTLVLYGIGQTTFLKDFSDTVNPTIQQNVVPSMPNQVVNQQQNISYSEAAEMFKSLQNINFVQLILAFLFYFLGGYLLYSALFAAVGSAVDSESDTQQFMMPITIPLVISFVAAQFIMQNPEGPLAFWLSIIPFTSPVIMMVRLPFGVPPWELALSMTLLVITFIFMTWLAGKIYRTGILMYGKKVSYKELWKWLRYSG